MIGPAQRRLDLLHGEPIVWYRSLGRCPCYDLRTGQYDTGHALCGGTGVLREEVVTKYKAIVADVRTSRHYTGIGPLETGDLTCSTWPQELPLGPDDQVVVPSRSVVANALLTRGSGADSLGFTNVTHILRIFDTNGPIAVGYTLNSDSVVWATGTGPAEGAQYAVSFRYCPRWMVVQEATLQRHPDTTGKPLPQVVGLKLIPPNV